jgi:hypothetical protein
MKEFTGSIQDKIKYYVYLYIDPRNEQIFYVGKGRGNRAFSHLKEKSKSEKNLRISDIQKDGLQPKIEILVHGLEDESTARKIEASIIDLLGIDNLTNIQSGYESREFGRMSTEQLRALYGAKKVIIRESAILININKSFRYGMSPVELYDASRSAWVLGLKREKPILALAVYQGIVQEVYKIASWFPNNTTLNSRKTPAEDPRDERWEFVGQIAEDSIRKRYRYNDVSDYMGPRNPINYVNCV